MGQEHSTEERAGGDENGVDVSDLASRPRPAGESGMQRADALEETGRDPQIDALDAYRASQNLVQPIPAIDYNTVVTKAKAQRASAKNINAEILKLEGENAALLSQLHKGETEPGFSGQGALGVPASIDVFENCLRVRGQAKMDPHDDSLDGNGMDVHVVRCGGGGEIGTVADGIDQCVVVVRGQTNFLCIESCTCVQVCCDHVMTAVLIMDCSKVTVMIGHDVPHITVQDSVGVEILGGDGSVESGIETVGCYGVYLSTVAQNVKSSLGAVDLMRAERRRSVPIPERMFTHMKNGVMTTVCRSGSSAANAASFAMNPNRNLIPIQLTDRQ